MGTPTKKRTSGERKRRASHMALKPIQLVRDEKNKLVPQRYAPKKTRKANRSSAPTQSKKKA